MEPVYYDTAKLERLRDRYARAVERGEESFTFEQHFYVTASTMFLIEFVSAGVERRERDAS